MFSHSRRILLAFPFTWFLTLRMPFAPGSATSRFLNQMSLLGWRAGNDEANDFKREEDEFIQFLSTKKGGWMLIGEKRVLTSHARLIYHRKWRWCRVDGGEYPFTLLSLTTLSSAGWDLRRKPVSVVRGLEWECGCVWSSSLVS
jgi:hypothetical protein